MANKFIIQKEDNLEPGDLPYKWVLWYGAELMCRSIGSFANVDEAREDIKKMKKSCNKYTKVEVQQ